MCDGLPTGLDGCRILLEEYEGAVGEHRKGEHHVLTPRSECDQNHKYCGEDPVLPEYSEAGDQDQSETLCEVEFGIRVVLLCRR